LDGAAVIFPISLDATNEHDRGFACRQEFASPYFHAFIL